MHIRDRRVTDPSTPGWVPSLTPDLPTHIHANLQNPAYVTGGHKGLASKAIRQDSCPQLRACDRSTPATEENADLIRD